MEKLRILTTGESHGPALVTVIDGLPAGLKISEAAINEDLKRRRKGYGRGPRMQIERDEIRVLSGLRFGVTIGSPLTLFIENSDWPAWEKIMPAFGKPSGDTRKVLRPRPGHADLAGMMKYGGRDARPILERSSARETAARVAAGAAAKALLTEFGIKVYSQVAGIGGVMIPTLNLSWEEIAQRVEASDVHCADETTAKKMRKTIDRAKNAGNTLGGLVNIAVVGTPPGLGTHTQWDRKLDGLLAQAIMSIQAIKSVEIGIGKEAALITGAAAHDEIFYDHKKKSFYRGSNNAGGIEGGISNGEPIMIMAAMKPIPTLAKPLKSVSIETKEEVIAAFERSDACAVPACAIVAEAMTALVIADQLLIKFGGDSLKELKRNYNSYLNSLRRI